MNDEEIMKRFNETFSDDVSNTEVKQPEVVTPYKATTNQNVAPTSMNVPTSSNVDIPPLNNTANATTPNVVNSTVSEVSNESTVEKQLEVNNNVSDKMMEVDKNNYSQPEVNSNVNYNYVPTYDSKKKKTISIKISPELMPVIIIVIILFIVIMIIPNVYDYFTHVR